MANIEVLKAKRKESKMTFEELSSKSGIPLRTLENIFHGVTKHPRIDTMQAIERALGLEEQKTPSDDLSEDEKRLAMLIAQMTDDEVKELSVFVDYILSKRK